MYIYTLYHDPTFRVRDIILNNITALGFCRGPAPVDPGKSKGGRRWRGKTSLLIDIRLD